MDEQSIFLNALEKETPEERSSFLDEVCGNDEGIRREVEVLLRAHAKVGGFLQGTPADLGKTIPQPITEQPGTLIGPYKLLQQIGEGGMGTVYMAEQTEPVERRVALKIIKPGMDSRQVIARFEAERQALAMMDHPNIAKVFDAGTTESGRPYFVMELVKGVPITEYCDQQQFTPNERLELFLPVCQAVQHAHQKGIIHRDLKPTNILVAEYDDRAVPKIIDFGVAKAVSQRLTEKTMFTQYGQIVGTIDYMSPEQAKLNQLDVDTRSDIYSLGVLLYELLTGETPFDKQRLRSAAFDELLRIIREEEPPRPSTRLSSSDTLPSVAANRKLEPAKLSALVRGELDWIVMKTLEKDRGRRYETASALSADITHYLNDEPVVACPPSAAYRFRKFARRNKVAIVTTVAVVLALITGTSIATWQAVRATNAEGLAQQRLQAERLAHDAEAQQRQEAEIARNDAESARHEAEAQRAEAVEQRDRAVRAEQSADAQRQRAEENHRRAREAVDRLLTKVAQDLEDTPQMEQIRRALLEDALEFYQVFLQQKGGDPTVRYETGLAYFRVADIERQLGRGLDCIQHYDAATNIFRELAEEFPARTDYREQLAHCDLRRGTALAQMYRYDDAAAAYENAAHGWKMLAAERPNDPVCLQELARVNLELSVFWGHRYFGVKALEYLQRAEEFLAQLARDFPNYPVDSSVTLRVPDALRMSAHQRREVAEVIRRTKEGSFTNLPHDAETLARLEEEGLELVKQWEQLAEAHPDVPEYRKSFYSVTTNYGCILLAMDRFDDAMRGCARLQVDISQLVARYPDIPEYRVALAWNEFNLGNLLCLVGRKNESVEHYRVAIETAKQLTERFPKEPRHLNHLSGMLATCPAPEICNAELAIACTERAMQLNGSPHEWRNLALAQMRAGKDEDALQSCARFRESLDADGTLHLIEAFALWHLRRFDEARASYQSACDMLDGTPNKYWYSPEVRLVRLEFEEMMRSQDSEETGQEPATSDTVQKTDN